MKKSFLLLILLIFMLLHPAITVTGASNGLLLWYSSVVPALFPFMVLSSLIVASGSLSVLMAPVQLVLGPLRRRMLYASFRPCLRLSYGRENLRRFFL